jgi:hypothetical protein
MEGAAENGKELSHSARADGMNECRGNQICSNESQFLSLNLRVIHNGIYLSSEPQHQICAADQ